MRVAQACKLSQVREYNGNSCGKSEERANLKSDQFFVSNEMDVRPPPAKKQKQYAGVYQADWG